MQTQQGLEESMYNCICMLTRLLQLVIYGANPLKDCF